MSNRSSLLLLIILPSNFMLCHTQWIDPFNMNMDNPREQKENVCDTPKTFSSDLLHYKRSINLLLSSVAVDRSDPSVYKGYLMINIPVESYEYLRRFTKEPEEDPIVLQKVDYILTRIFTKPTIEQLTDVMLSWSDHLYFTIFNRATAILVSVLLITFLCYKLLRANWSLWNVIKYLLFLAWLTDYAFTWIHLLQEDEIDKIADTLRYGNVPPECDPNKMTYMQYFLSAFSKEDECRKYHRLVLRDIFWSVAPFTVFAHQFGKIILTPATYVGGAVSNLTREMLNGLFWPLNVLLLPILLVFTLILICIALSFLTRTTFKVNLFHLLQFHFGGEERKAVGEVLSSEHLTKLIDGALHRPMVQEVKYVRPPKKYSKQSKGNKDNKALKNEPELVDEDKNKDNKKARETKEVKPTSSQSKSDRSPRKDVAESKKSSGFLTRSFCKAFGEASLDKSGSASSNSIDMSNNSISSTDLEIN